MSFPYWTPIVLRMPFFHWKMIDGVKLWFSLVFSRTLFLSDSRVVLLYVRVALVAVNNPRNGPNFSSPFQLTLISGHVMFLDSVLASRNVVEVAERLNRAATSMLLVSWTPESSVNPTVSESRSGVSSSSPLYMTPLFVVRPNW